MTVFVSDVQEGTVLIPDAGFTCLPAAVPVIVKDDPREGLYVPCACGRHYLSGQIDRRPVYVGFRRGHL